MRVIETVHEMQESAESFRKAGEIISFVPTMGYLHEGHLELMRIGKQHSHRLIVSIFVNPTQFGPSEDFDKYPRDTPGDLEKVQGVGAELVFLPSVQEMYPQGFQCQVRVQWVTQHLCGLSRPGHFDGVTTVVAKLFHIIKPHIAIFGQKDYQQLTVITRMVMDLDMDVEIIGVPTIREPDGLAMSSRNKYLSPEERTSALCLTKSLDLAQEMVDGGERGASVIKRAIESLIGSHPFTRIDYVSLCDPVTLEDRETLADETLLAVAVQVGKTRLIDNATLRKG